jgi:ribosomal protein L11 methyltransferase
VASIVLAFDALLKRRLPRRIVDIGCGTGVLAIAAAKALHVPVLASDVDPEAVQVTGRNARLNEVAPLIRAVRGAGLTHPWLRAGAPYDLIFANILARPLVSLAQELSQAISRDSILILSGLTSDQSREVSAAYRNRGLALTNTLQLGSWTTLCLSTLVPRGEGQL